ncbi:MAG: D-sedoheptulose-7-phosphate isomerase [Candidatus Eiseniibacteriota bacterium]
MEQHARAALRESSAAMRRLERTMAHPLAEAAEAAIVCLESGGTIYFCGNGGSAADAQHLAAELAGRYLVERPPLAAVALSTNSSALTAIGNDYGFQYVFSRQLEALGTPGDVLVAITTSGESLNVRHAVQLARTRGITVIGMTGLKGRKFAAECDHALVAPHASTPHIQEAHIAMGHAFCELIEVALFPPGAAPRRARHSAGSRAANRSSRPRKARRRKRK